MTRVFTPRTALVACAALLAFSLTHSAQAQVGIGTTTPRPDALLDLRSTEGGLLIPRLSTPERLTLGTALTSANNALDAGMLVYDVNDQQLYFWDRSTPPGSWQSVGGSATLSLPFFQSVNAPGATAFEIRNTSGSGTAIRASNPAGGTGLRVQGATVLEDFTPATGAVLTADAFGLVGIAPFTGVSTDVLRGDGTFGPGGGGGLAAVATAPSTQIFFLGDGTGGNPLSAAIQPNAITGTEILDESITGNDILDGTIGLSDIDNFQLSTFVSGFIPLPTANSLSGDATGIEGFGGNIPTTVTGLQGRPVPDVAPNVGQVLKWNNTGTAWEPADDVGLAVVATNNTPVINFTGDGTAGTPLEANIAAASIGTSLIAADAITTGLIAAGAVQNADIANNAVNSAQIIDGNVTAADLAAGLLTGAGDVTGALGANTVVRLQGRDLSAALPADGQVLKWNDVAMQWEPAADLNGGGTFGGADNGLTVNGSNEVELGGTLTQNTVVNLGANTLTFQGDGLRSDAIATGTALDLTPAAGSVVVSNSNGEIDNLDWPNNTTTFLRGDGTFAVPPTGAVSFPLAGTAGSTSATLSITATSSGAGIEVQHTSGGTALAVSSNGTGIDVSSGTVRFSEVAAGAGNSAVVIADAGGVINNLNFPNNTTEFLRADGTFATPAGGGTVTSVGTGAGLTGGPITGAGTIAVATGGITTTLIANDAITTTLIAPGAVGTSDIAADAITSGLIAPAAVGTSDIAADAITTALILDGTVATVDIAANAITSGLIAAGAVGTSDIAADAITSGLIAAGAVGTTDIAPDAITSGLIAAGAVGTTDIAADAITTGLIAPGAVGTTDIAADAITTTLIAPGAVGTSDIAADAITTALILDGTVATADIAANAITSGLIAAGAVGTSDIANNAITTGLIADGTITPADIAPGVVNGSVLTTDGAGAELWTAAPTLGGQVLTWNALVAPARWEPTTLAVFPAIFSTSLASPLLTLTNTGTGGVTVLTSDNASGTAATISNTVAGGTALSIPQGEIDFDPIAGGVNGAVVTVNNAGVLNRTNFTGSSTDFLRGDGSFGPAAGSGANLTLSNLTGPTAVNQSLVPGVATLDLGTGATGWRDAYLTGAVFIDNAHFMSNGGGAGVNNTILGIGTGFATAGDGNTFLGQAAGAGSVNVASDNNTFVGRAAGTAITSGATNTAVGSQAGLNVNGASTGNVFVGSNTGRGSLGVVSEAIAIGFGTQVGSNRAVAVGFAADAEGAGSVALGNSGALTNGSIAIGLAIASGGNSAIAIGDNAAATQANAIALGTSTDATVAGAVAIGNTSSAGASNALALGSSADATGGSAIAIGSNTTADGASSVALGDGANAATTGAVAVGAAANAATGLGAIAIGEDAESLGAGSMALGQSASVGSFGDAIAIGRAATVTAANAVALGADVIASQANTIILGDGATSYDVGIGTGTPTARLHVEGNTRLNITNATPQAQVLGIAADGTLHRQAAGGTGANTALSNLVATAINQSLVPNANNAFDLGEATVRWRNLYLTRVVFLGNDHFMSSAPDGGGLNNTVLGRQTGFATAGSANTFIGSQAGTATLAAASVGNTMVGALAGRASNARQNTFIGSQAGEDVTSGESNVFVGERAAPNATTARDNTVLGQLSANQLATGFENVLIGGSAGNEVVDGDRNTFVGVTTGFVAAGDFNRSAGLGYNARVTASNQLALGGTGVDAVNVGINTANPQARLHVEGETRLNITNATAQTQVLGIAPDGTLHRQAAGLTIPLNQTVNSPSPLITLSNSGSGFGAVFTASGTGAVVRASTLATTPDIRALEGISANGGNNSFGVAGSYAGVNDDITQPSAGVYGFVNAANTTSTGRSVGVMGITSGDATTGGQTAGVFARTENEGAGLRAEGLGLTSTAISAEAQGENAIGLQVTALGSAGGARAAAMFAPFAPITLELENAGGGSALQVTSGAVAILPLGGGGTQMVTVNNTGVLGTAALPAVGANTSLSNLTATSINQSLIPNGSAFDLGNNISATTRWEDLHLGGGVTIDGARFITVADGTFSTFVGSSAGVAAPAGFNNTILGASAGDALAAGDFNTIMGANAGGNLNGGAADNNVLIGDDAGFTFTTSAGNTVVGANAGGSITSGGGNVLVGNDAGAGLNTTSAGNVFVGERAGLSGLGVVNNAVGVGVNSNANSTGSVAIGANAETNAADAIAIGANAATNAADAIAIGVGASVAATGTNGIAIGYFSTADQTSSVAIGDRVNVNTNNVIALGDGTPTAYRVGINNAAPLAEDELTIDGLASASTVMRAVNDGTGRTATDGFSISMNNAGLTNITAHEANDLRLQTAGITRMTMSGTGEVGINAPPTTGVNVNIGAAAGLTRFNGPIQFNRVSLGIIVNSDNFNVNPNTEGTLIQLNSDNATAANRTVVLANGNAIGQVVVIHYFGLTNTLEFNTTNSNVRLDATPFAMNIYDTLTLMWDGTDWVELSRSTND